MSFANQTAVITGASSGIGRALAVELARQGCKVGLLARRAEYLRQLADEVRQSGGTAAVALADVADRKQTVSAIGELARQLGPIDLLIANAGVGRPTHVGPLNVEDQELLFRVNVLGVIYALEAVLPAMLERRRGHLAAVSSTASFKGLPGESGYCASKAAVNAYMEGLRIQLRDRGITVTTICPGFVRTEMTANNRFPMPWLLEADEAARRMVRALARRRKVYTFPWQMRLLLAAAQWAPDWLIARVMQDRQPSWPVSAP